MSKLAIGRLTNDAQLDLVARTSITAYALIGPINAGARHLSKHTSLGFQGPSEETTNQKMEDAVMQEVKRLFNPEFINRLDEIIIFNSLTNEDLGHIVDMMVAQLNENLAHKRLEVSITDDAKQWILDKACRDKNYGARPLRRAIQRYIEDPLSEELIRGHLHGGDIEVYLDAGALAYRPAGELEAGRKLA